MRAVLSLRDFAMLRTWVAVLAGKLTLWRTVFVSALMAPLCTTLVQQRWAIVFDDKDRAHGSGRKKWSKRCRTAPRQSYKQDVELLRRDRFGRLLAAVLVDRGETIRALLKILGMKDFGAKPAEP
ncbi:MAG: hypothetical protein JNL98_03785 [Bryobacterales bacterium]|nr:hypothetical protein [Bryobacterales bacterium]